MNNMTEGAVKSNKFNIPAFFDKVRRMKGGNIILVFIVLQILAIIFSLIFPTKFRYLSVANIQVLLKSIPLIGVTAMGVNLLMISGEFDLSVGAIYTFSALIMSKAFNIGLPVIVCMLIALAIGAASGLINGTIVTRIKVPSFIITLGTLFFWRGMIYVVTKGQSEAFHIGNITKIIFDGNISFMQAQFIWLLIVVIICYFILEKTSLGNHMFAAGGNASAAKAAGINVDKTKLIAFIIVGLLAAFSGILSTVRVEAVNPVQGEGIELEAIAACVIGGTSLMGGRGSVIGAFLGAAILFTVQDILLLLRAPGSYLKLFLGIVIIIAVIINKYAEKRED